MSINERRIPIAPNGIFDTIQGEGAMMGVPMTFVRLAGCSVGCRECDTDYTVADRLDVAELVERLQRLPRREWIWLTGGEPTDHQLGQVVKGLRADGYRIALATSGVRTETQDGWKVHEGFATGGVDFLSVSPHWLDDRWKLRGGSQLNVVPGLNGVRLGDLEGFDTSRFGTRYVTPCDGNPESLAECLAWVRRHPGWRLGHQAHKGWKLP